MIIAKVGNFILSTQIFIDGTHVYKTNEIEVVDIRTNNTLCEFSDDGRVVSYDADSLLDSLENSRDLDAIKQLCEIGSLIVDTEHVPNDIESKPLKTTDSVGAYCENVTEDSIGYI